MVSSVGAGCVVGTRLSGRLSRAHARARIGFSVPGPSPLRSRRAGPIRRGRDRGAIISRWPVPVGVAAAAAQENRVSAKRRHRPGARRTRTHVRGCSRRTARCARTAVSSTRPEPSRWTTSRRAAASPLTIGATTSCFRASAATRPRPTSRSWRGCSAPGRARATSLRTDSTSARGSSNCCGLWLAMTRRRPYRRHHRPFHARRNGPRASCSGPRTTTASRRTSMNRRRHRWRHGAGGGVGEAAGSADRSARHVARAYLSTTGRKPRM